MAIIRNAAQCTHCGDIIESTHRHDFVRCSCPDDSGHGIFVDGGKCYLRRGYMVMQEFKELSELQEEDETT